MREPLFKIIFLSWKWNCKCNFVISWLYDHFQVLFHFTSWRGFHEGGSLCYMQIVMNSLAEMIFKVLFGPSAPWACIICYAPYTPQRAFWRRGVYLPACNFLTVYTIWQTTNFNVKTQRQWLNDANETLVPSNCSRGKSQYLHSLGRISTVSTKVLTEKQYT